MRTSVATWAACLLALILASTARTQDGKVAKAGATEQAIREGLRQAANRGADLFNVDGDPLGCYRVYQGALFAVRPLLARHPELQKAIDDGLAAADRHPRAAERAFALRKVIDDLRLRMKGTEAAASEKKALTSKDSLWERLGGEDTVRRVVAEFVRTAADDPKVNLTRGGKLKLEEKAVANLKNKLVELISQATGGPLKYTGIDLRKGHKGMKITDAEFDAAAGHLQKALAKHGARPADVKALLKIVEGTRADIVERPGKDRADDQAPKMVRYNGKPLSLGLVTLIEDKSKQSYSTIIGPDGTYRFPTPIHAGAYVVLVSPDPNAKGKQVALPPRYADPRTSPLKVEVRSGGNTVDIELR
jgi:hemoglobin